MATFIGGLPFGAKEGGEKWFNPLSQQRREEINRFDGFDLDAARRVMEPEPSLLGDFKITSPDIK